MWFFYFFCSKGTLEAKEASLALKSGSGNFIFKDVSMKSIVLNDITEGITIWYHKPKNLSASAPIVFVMHGQSRTAENYRDVWRTFSDKGNFILIVPEISDDKTLKCIYCEKQSESIPLFARGY